MDPPKCASPALRTRGWDIPEEVLRHILSSFELRLKDEYGGRESSQRAKQALVAPSLVNRYWSTTIRPLLFRSLRLESLEDALFLQEVVRKPALATPGMMTIIHDIHIWYDYPPTKHWVCHLHWLMNHLRMTHFNWYIKRDEISSTSTSVKFNPYTVIPSVTPSFLRISLLHLEGLQFENCSAFMRLVDSFSDLRDCSCSNLSIVDLSPYTPPRWRQRQSAMQRSLKSCLVKNIKNMPPAAQVALASDLCRTSERLGFEAWRPVCDALVALVSHPWEYFTLDMWPPVQAPFERAAIRFTMLYSELEYDVTQAEIRVHRPKARPLSSEERLHARSWSMELTPVFTGMHTTGSTSLDALHSGNLAALSSLEQLVIRARPDRKDSLSGMTKILCGVLRRTQLSWALDSRRLTFVRGIGEKWYTLASDDILSVPAEHVVDGVPLALDVPEQAEWLLCFEPEARDAYLRRVLARRAEALVPAATAASPQPTADGRPAFRIGYASGHM